MPSSPPITLVIIASRKPLREINLWMADRCLSLTRRADVAARGNDPVYFRFFDATAQAMFLYRALEQTVMKDLREEIDYLLGLDRARTRLRNEIDWPGQSLDLFINIVRLGGGTLSQAKRRSQFGWMKDEEVQRFVPMVNEAFEMNAELDSGRT